MQKKLFIFTFLLTLICSTISPAADTISLSIPQSIIAETISKALPIQFNENSESLAGTIAINRVDNLEFGDQAISGRLSLSGRDMQLNTSFGSQQIRVNVGNVDLSFSVSATTRYDKATRTLLLHPTVTSFDEQGSQSSEIGKLIVALFNDQDIPIILDDFEPLMTDIGGRKLVVETEVENVILKPGKLKVHLLPRTSVTK